MEDDVFAASAEPRHFQLAPGTREPTVTHNNTQTHTGVSRDSGSSYPTTTPPPPPTPLLSLLTPHPDSLPAFAFFYLMSFCCFGHE